MALNGYVLIARQEGAESVNCGTHVPNSAAYHDIHISIVQNPDDTECSGVVAETVPHHRPAIGAQGFGLPSKQVIANRFPLLLRTVLHDRHGVEPIDTKYFTSQSVCDNFPCVFPRKPFN